MAGGKKTHAPIKLQAQNQWTGQLVKMTPTLRRRNGAASHPSNGRGSPADSMLSRSSSSNSEALEPRDWLGRGGLMGNPWDAFPADVNEQEQVHRKRMRNRAPALVLRLKVYFLASVWLSVAFLYFLWQLPLLLLHLIPDGGALYKRACTHYDRLVQPAILAVPFSWCGFRVWCCTPAELRRVPACGSSVFMTNHGSRVDWLVGLLMGSTLEPQVRVGFCAEFTTMLMPIFGWSRGLFGDIFLRRTFHRDGPRILDNIKSFKEAKVDRVIFLAPEGAIVDPGVEKDAEYVQQCSKFMLDHDRRPLKYLLTPRYKGMQLVTTHNPEGIFSVTMAFVCRDKDSVQVDELTGAARGGCLCSRPLDDPARVIPDLHTIFRGGLHVFTHIVKVPGEKMSNDDPKGVRDTLLDDYARKDALLQTFRETGAYSSDPEQYMLPIRHVRMNATLVLLAAWTCWVAKFVLGWSLRVVMRRVGISFVVLFLMHAFTHLHAERISGASRESLLFETVLKMLMQRWMGGKLDHGGASSQEKARQQKSRLATL